MGFVLQGLVCFRVTLRRLVYTKWSKTHVKNLATNEVRFLTCLTILWTPSAIGLKVFQNILHEIDFFALNTTLDISRKKVREKWIDLVKECHVRRYHTKYLVYLIIRNYAMKEFLVPICKKNFYERTMYEFKKDFEGKQLSAKNKHFFWHCFFRKGLPT